MTANKPFFSIIIPTYNRAKFILRTLQSVLSQTYSSYEIIVVDDGGKDNTEEIVNNLYVDKIRYYRKENEERGAARNYGWLKANGKYITFLDSDDILYPTHLLKAYQYLVNNKDVKCYAQAYEVKNAISGEVITKAFRSKTTIINNQIIKGNILSCFGVFLKKEVYQELRFEEDRRFAGSEDWLLWLQLSARYSFYYNNVITGALLEHDSRSVLSFKEESLVFRTNFIKDKLLCDDVFVKKFGRITVQKIYAHMLSYTSLHLAMSLKKNDALCYWMKAVSANFYEFFTRRSLAITKKILFL